VIGRPGLDLHENEDLAIKHHQVEFIGAGPPIRSQDVGSGPLIVPAGPAFALGAQGATPLPPTKPMLPESLKNHAKTKPAGRGRR
jgi:hypothetical protein